MSVDPITCPECFSEIGSGCTTEEQLRGAFSRHKGSKTCKQLAAHARRVLDMQKVAAGERAGEGDAEPPADAELAEAAHRGLGLAPNVVVFESPMRELKVLCDPGGPVLDGNSNRVDHKPAIYARFRDGRYVTSDPKIIATLRRAPNNQARLREQGVTGQGLMLHKDRFYEVETTAKAG